MNELHYEKIEKLFAAFAAGRGIRATAREVGCNRETVARYRRAWIKAKLQAAYDLLCDGNSDGCDAITALLPKPQVMEMLDAWLDDQCDSNPKSKWY